MMMQTIKHGDGRANSWVITAVVAAVLVIGGVVLRAAEPGRLAPTTACTLEVTGAATQPAGLPICMAVTLTNTGKDPISYWCAGPGDYPQAEYFAAELTPVGNGGKTHTCKCFNGQYNQWSDAARYEIKPGGSVKVPLVIAPLAAGQYEIVIQSCEEKWPNPKTKVEDVVWPAGRSAVLHITVLDDAKLAGATRDAWVARILTGEPLAERMAIQWKTPEVTAKLVPALEGDDDKAAIGAAKVLWHLQTADLPKETGAAVAKGIEKGLRPREHATSAEPNLLIYLAMVAGIQGSDEALPAMVKLAHAENVFNQARWRAVQSLAGFHQPQATEELRTLSQDKDDWVRSAAAIDLAEREDIAAIPVLLDLIGKSKQFREYQVEALAHFPNDPRAVAAIEAALTDSDDLTREMAKDAWEKVKAAQNKPKAETRPK